MIACSRLRLDAEEDVSGRVADFVGALARRAGLTSRQAYRLRLAVDEITTNVAQHGYGNGRGVVDLAGGIEEERVWVRIEDDAPAFDPTHQQRKPLPSNGPREGGYGLFLAFRNVDEFIYDYIGGRNQNTLVISRAADGADLGGRKGGTDGRNESLGRR